MSVCSVSTLKPFKKSGDPTYQDAGVSGHGGF